MEKEQLVNKRNIVDYLIQAGRKLDEAKTPTLGRNFWCPFCEKMHSSSSGRCEEMKKHVN